jgi:hypothetical protein
MRLIKSAAKRLAQQTHRARTVRGGVAAAAIAALAVATAPDGLAAQQGSEGPVSYILTAEGQRVPLQRHRGFQLFGEADLAASGMAQTGDYGWLANNVGPCPFYFTFDSERCEIGPGGDPYFHIDWLAGAPISEFRKIRVLNPGISDALNLPATGYTTPFTIYLVPPNARRWGPADGEFGNLFSGVTSTDDGSCRDDSGGLNGNLPANFTLLAGSDCPETWPSSGFGGLRPVLDEGWLAEFQASPSTFHFDDYKLPESAFDQTQFLGSFSTYGTTSDSYREIIQRFGGVTKLGSGPSSERGYPLGLDIRFDAFQFGRPSVGNATFYRLLLINNSQRLYGGAGVDYDSLYFGMSFGMLNDGQFSTSWYHDFSRNTMILPHGNTSGNCSGTYPPNRAAGGCPASDGATHPIYGISFLKSPLGDARFRLFSDPSSQFYNPSSPFVGDTITWNHAGGGGFGAVYNATHVHSDKALFGFMAGMEDVFLAGRDINDFTTGTFHTLFQNEDFQGIITPAVAKFNKYAPPGWDYDHDGIQDTIAVPTCGRSGCTVLYSDTIPGGLRNRISNVGNVVDAGPFKLASGDTTEFILAFMGGTDSLSFENLLNSVIATYLGNYAGPSPVPPPSFTSADVDVTSADIRDSTVFSANTSVRIRIAEPDPFDDKFVIRVRDKILSDPGNATAQRLVALNPNLLDDVASRIRNNYAQLLVFKSCDNGATFTVSADCTPAESEDVDGSDLGFGWQPIEIINVDTTTGHLEDHFFTDVVQPGREYLYSFVTRTRGLIDLVVLDSIDTPSGKILAPTNLQAALSLDADTVNSPLFRSGPHTVKFYAPITRPAGTKLGQVDTARVSGLGTAEITITPRSNIQAGLYRLMIANRFIITTVQDTVHGDVTQTVEAQRVLERASTTPDSTTGIDEFVAQTQTFTGTGLLSTLEAIPLNRVSTVDSIVTFVDTLVASDLGFILTGGTAGDVPLLISTELESPGIEFEQSLKFPGFLFGFADESDPRANFILRSPTDTLNETVANANAVEFQDGDEEGAGGVFRLEWQGDAFGPGAPFLFADQPELQPVIQASLNARPIAQTGDVSPEVEALLPGDSRPLIAVKLPFKVIGPSGEQAVVAMRARNSGTADSIVANSRLIGSGIDTTRVEVPADVWLPGDELFILTNALRDSTVGNTTVVSDTTIAGQNAQAPIQVRSLSLDFSEMIIGCDDNNTQTEFECNPIALGTRGSSGYLPMENGWVSVIDFSRDLDLFSEIQLTATATTASATPLTDADLDRIRIVPNPYIVQSDVDVIDAGRTGQPTIMFTSMPAEGRLKIYTVSGQFVQQLSWTASDLVATGSGLMTGDLPYNLRSREGLDIGSGLYIAVITPTGPNANGKTVSKKFVVIR